MSRELPLTELNEATDTTTMLIQKAREQIAKTAAAPCTQIDFGHLFKNSIAQDFTRLKPSIVQRPPTRQKLVVTIADLYEKRVKPVRLIVDRLCDQCNGRRSQLDRDFTCTACMGQGEVESAIGGLDFQTPYKRKNKCGVCAGEGVVVTENDRCWQCSGAGLLSEPIVVKVPLAQVEPESALKNAVILEQQGDASVRHGEAAGNLEFNLDIAPHSTWALVGRYYYTIKQVPTLSGLLGRPFEIVLPDNEKKQEVFCNSVLRDDQLLVNEEQSLLVRVKFIYPNELLNLDLLYQETQSDPDFHRRANCSATEMILANERVQGYYIRFWGNRRTNLTPQE